MHRTARSRGCLWSSGTAIVTRWWSEDPADIPLVFAGLLPVLLVAGDPLRAIVGAIVSIPAIGLRKVRRSPQFWWTVTAVYFVWWVFDWRTIDNHMALVVVWFLTVATFVTGRSIESFRSDARLIIGLVFTFAVGWKLRSPDFLSGNFFTYTLLTDPRFEPLVRLFTDLDQASLVTNRLQANTSTTPFSLTGTAEVAGLATLLTVGTLVVEGLVAISWLVSRSPAWLRHTSLATFGLVTYAIVPVAGFGLVLFAIACGSSESPVAQRRYLLGGVVLFVFAALWNVLVL